MANKLKVSKGLTEESFTRDRSDVTPNDTHGSISHQHNALKTTNDNKFYAVTQVYTTKLDDMIILNNKSISSINVKYLISDILSESKPMCKNINKKKQKNIRKKPKAREYIGTSPRNNGESPVINKACTNIEETSPRKNDVSPIIKKICAYTETLPHKKDKSPVNNKTCLYTETSPHRNCESPVINETCSYTETSPHRNDESPVINETCSYTETSPHRNDESPVINETCSYTETSPHRNDESPVINQTCAYTRKSPLSNDVIPVINQICAYTGTSPHRNNECPVINQTCSYTETSPHRNCESPVISETCSYIETSPHRNDESPVINQTCAYTRKSPLSNDVTPVINQICAYTGTSPHRNNECPVINQTCSYTETSPHRNYESPVINETCAYIGTSPHRNNESPVIKKVIIHNNMKSHNLPETFLCKNKELLELCKPFTIKVNREFKKSITNSNDEINSIWRAEKQSSKNFVDIDASLLKPINFDASKRETFSNVPMPIVLSNIKTEIEDNIESSLATAPEDNLPNPNIIVIDDDDEIEDADNPLDICIVETRSLASEPLKIPSTSSDSNCFSEIQKRYKNVVSTLRIIDKNTGDEESFAVGPRGGHIATFKSVETYIQFKENHLKNQLDTNVFLAAKDINIEYCCYYNMLELIHKIDGYISKSMFRALSVKHKCLEGYCICCCKNKIENNADCQGKEGSKNYSESYNDDQIILTLENKITNAISSIQTDINAEQDLLRVNNQKVDSYQVVVGNKDMSSPLLMKAYNTQIKSNSTKNSRIFFSKNVTPKNIYFSTKYLIVFANEKNCVLDVYEVSCSGNINSHLTKKIQTKVKYNYENIKNILKSNYDLASGHLKFFNICCWFRQMKCLEQLRKCMKFSLAFLASTHTCKLNKCSCCCINETKCSELHTSLPIRIENVYSMNNLAGTSNDKQNHNSATTNIKLSDKPTCLNNQLTTDFENNLPMSVLQKATNSVASTANTALKDITPSTIVHLGSASTTTNFNLKQPIKTYSKVKSKPKSNDTLTDEVNIIISEILNRFKNVKLNLNAHGKVTAVLDTPKELLSTLELKILGQILSYAQQHVNTLDFSKGVNMEKLMTDVGQKKQVPSLPSTIQNLNSHIEKSIAINIPKMHAGQVFFNNTSTGLSFTPINDCQIQQMQNSMGDQAMNNTTISNVMILPQNTFILKPVIPVTDITPKVNRPLILGKRKSSNQFEPSVSSSKRQVAVQEIDLTCDSMEYKEENSSSSSSVGSANAIDIDEDSEYPTLDNSMDLESVPEDRMDNDDECILGM